MWVLEVALALAAGLSWGYALERLGGQQRGVAWGGPVCTETRHCVVGGSYVDSRCRYREALDLAVGLSWGCVLERWGGRQQGGVWGGPVFIEAYYRSIHCVVVSRNL